MYKKMFNVDKKLIDGFDEKISFWSLLESDFFDTTNFELTGTIYFFLNYAVYRFKLSYLVLEQYVIKLYTGPPVHQYSFIFSTIMCDFLIQNTYLACFYLHQNAHDVFLKDANAI